MKNLFALAVILTILSSGCSKEIADTPVVLAEYTLGSGGDCTGAIASGRFVADTALTANNTVTITVDVSLAGPYWIATNTANGISFSSIGTFSGTGPQTVVLTGEGTPVATDTTDFTLTALNGAGGSCTFSVITVHGILPHYYLTCFLDGVYKNFGDSAHATNSNVPGTSGVPGLVINGIDTVINSTSKIEFGISNAGSVKAGTYTDTSSSRAYFSYLDATGETWSENSGSLPSLTIIVTYAGTTNVQGTFSGTIKNQQGLGTGTIVVTNGSFSVPVK